MAVLPPPELAGELSAAPGAGGEPSRSGWRWVRSWPRCPPSRSDPHRWTRTPCRMRCSRRSASGPPTLRGMRRAGWSPWPGAGSSTGPAPTRPGAGVVQLFPRQGLTADRGLCARSRGRCPRSRPPGMRLRWGMAGRGLTSTSCSHVVPSPSAKPGRSALRHLPHWPKAGSREGEKGAGRHVVVVAGLPQLPGEGWPRCAGDVVANRCKYPRTACIWR
jgi:hypothetical protein